MGDMKTLKEMEAEGFEEVIEVSLKANPQTSPKKEVAPYVVVDNTEQLEAMNRSNKLMCKALNEITAKISEINQRPKAMDMKFKRTSAGFMDSVRITFKY